MSIACIDFLSFLFSFYFLMNISSNNPSPTFGYDAVWETVGLILYQENVINFILCGRRMSDLRESADHQDFQTTTISLVSLIL